MIIITLTLVINRYGNFMINNVNGDDMEYWFIAYKVRVPEMVIPYAGHKIVETEVGSHPILR